jgi:hypothetical protein
MDLGLPVLFRRSGRHTDVTRTSHGRHTDVASRDRTPPDHQNPTALAPISGAVADSGLSTLVLPRLAKPSDTRWCFWCYESGRSGPTRGVRG